MSRIYLKHKSKPRVSSRVLKVEFNIEYLNNLSKIVDTKTNCWLFQGPIKAGYGIINNGTKKFKAHRVSASIWYNKDYYDMSWMACHKVICPNRNCFNPEHLYPGTNKENTKDKMELGNHHYQKLKCCTICGGKFTLVKARSGVYNGKFRRVCRPCAIRRAVKAQNKKGEV